MTTELSSKRLIIVASPPETELAPALRSLGHQVSVVPDLDEAAILLESSGFDLALLASDDARVLLQRSSAPNGSVLADALETTRIVASELLDLLLVLRRNLDDGRPAQRPEPETVAALIRVVHEVVDDLRGPGAEQQYRVVRLEDVVDAAALMTYATAAERNQRLAIAIEDCVASIYTDQSTLRRVLVTLLEHASHQSGSEGRITVRAINDGSDCVISMTFVGGPTNMLALRQLFDPADASGVVRRNLAWVQKLVDRLHGRLWVESQIGGETTVFVALPDSRIEGSDSARNGDRSGEF